MSHPLRRFHAHAERIADEQKLGRILLETGASKPARTARTAEAADGRDLRGIPAIGRSVSGAINGTVPHLQR